MTAKQLIRIAAALAAAIFVWGLAVMLRTGGDEIEQGALLGPLSEEQADQIEVLGTADTIVLRRVDAGWQVNGFDADPERVREFFSYVASPVKGSVVAQSASSHERMGVAEGAGKRLRVLQGGQPLTELIFGNRGRAYQTAYVRRVGADANVYLLEGDLVGAVDRTVTDWRDKRIVTAPGGDIGAISIARGGTGFRLVRGAAGWAFANGDPVDSIMIERFLEKFNPLLAQGASFATPEQADTLDFSKPDRVLTLQRASGDTIVSLVFHDTENDFFVRRADRPTVFVMMNYKANEITPIDSLFRPKANPGS